MDPNDHPYMYFSLNSSKGGYIRYYGGNIIIEVTKRDANAHVYKTVLPNFGRHSPFSTSKESKAPGGHSPAQMRRVATITPSRILCSQHL